MEDFEKLKRKITESSVYPSELSVYFTLFELFYNPIN